MSSPPRTAPKACTNPPSHGLRIPDELGIAHENHLGAYNDHILALVNARRPFSCQNAGRRRASPSRDKGYRHAYSRANKSQRRSLPLKIGPNAKSQRKTRRLCNRESRIQPEISAQLTWGAWVARSAAPPLRRRPSRGFYEVSRRPERTAPRDDRGPVVRTAETAQTFLTAAGVDTRVSD